MGELKPYPEYKDSGIEWLGQVPQHWELRKMRTLLKPSNKRNQPSLPLLSVVREKGVIKRDVSSRDENYNYIPEDLSNYKVVRSGQFAMNKMKAWQGSYGISKYDGIVSPAYFVFDLNCVIPEFFHQAIRSKAYVPFFCQASDGVRVGQWDLSKTRMKEIPFAIPFPDEQRKIVAFLLSMLKKLDDLIKAYKRLVGVSKSVTERKNSLLYEYRTRLISDVVTGKIDVRGIPVEQVEEITEPAEALLEEGEELEEAEKAEEAVDAD